MASHGYAMEKLEIELFISKEFKSIFDLGYALVDLQALITSMNYVAYEKRGYKKLPITSRTFAVKYRDELLLKEFHQGSFRSSLISGVLAGLIVLFTEKVYDSTKAVTPPAPPAVVNINIENIYHIDNSRTFNVRSHNERVNQQIIEIINRTTIVPGDSEASTLNLINEINSSEILGDHQIPTDEQGIKAIATSVERFTKTME